MKKQIMSYIRRQAILALLIAGALLLPQSGFAASTGTTSLLLQSGSGYATSGGDYISSHQGAGLNTLYQYYIEVPSGLSRLRVRIYDADIGRGGTNDANDFEVSNNWDTACRYRLYNPSNTQVATLTGNATTGTNAGWISLYDTTATPIPNGHWRLDVNSSSTITTGDDYNGYGISADDGDDTSGGTELNIYAFSFLPIGVKGPSPTTKTTTFYPYVTSGCTVGWNDFDGDNTATIYAQLSYASHAGAIPTTTYNGAANDVWLPRSITGYSTDDFNVDSGIWTATGRYTTLSGSTGNFGVFWAGNWLAAAGAPSTQPQANSFRVYLPTDGGGAPAKPVISQKISFVAGPNPPVTGSTTTVRVEIIVFNPAAQAITFSASNLVTAYIPGSGVVYAGDAVTSQGSVTTPAIGGVGAVTWNPGTVAGNNTYAVLYYAVNVTPVNGTRLPVTGTPASNGTTARYVDETGNTTQAAATYTYGPLCELAVTPGSGTIPTWVAISCFEANMASGQPMVEWHTASENGTVGFYLWRKDSASGDYQLVNPNFLPALANAMAGGVYRLVDPSAQYGEKVVYRLEEVNAQGNSQNYGPFTVTFDAAPENFQETGNFYKKNSSEIPTTVSGFQSAVLTASEYEKNRQLARSNVLLTQGSLPATQGSRQARIAVKSLGLFHIAATSIANALGMSVAQIDGLITSQQLSLSNLGKPVAWLVDENRNGIYFYGENLQSPYSDQNIYWLEQGSGLALAAVSGGSAAPAAANQTFNEIRHYEENRIPLTSLFTKPDDDFWLWDLVVAGADSKSFSIQVPGRAATGTATLTVNLQGATNTAAANDHHVQVILNGTQIGESWWDGITAHSCRFSFNQSLLADGGNTIVVSGVLDGGVPYSYFYVNSFDLSYQRYYQAVNNTLWCQGGVNQTISVAGFTDSPVMVWDVTVPRQPKLLSGVAMDAGGRVTFVPRDPNNKYLVIALSAALQPFSVNAASSTNLKQSNNSAEYLVIAPKEFANKAQQLADYRRGQGLTAMVVTLEDIYNSFNSGLASPLAIKYFLNYAYAKWSGKGLKYAVLVGRGTFDYKDYLGYGDNLVPVILTNTSDGLFAADNLYGDVKGDDGIPEIAIGRLPVVSVEELQIVINKIKAYGNSQGPWTDRALLIADNADSGGNFLSTSETLIRQINGYAINRISLLGTSNAAQTRLAIIAGFNTGAALVNYVGHGGLDQLAEENIFNISDLPLLQNNSNLPIMILVTCAAGRFDIPGYVCLSEALLLKDNGGIVAALAPSGAAFNSQSSRLIEEFYKAVFHAKEKDLGTAWLKAAKNFILQAGKTYMLNIYNLLGDPAVKFK
jgi:hypothetical protein